MVIDLWVGKPIDHLNDHLNEIPIRLHDPTIIVQIDHLLDLVHPQAA